MHTEHFHPHVSRAGLLSSVRALEALLSSMFQGLVWKWLGRNSLFPWMLTPTIQTPSAVLRIGGTAKRKCSHLSHSTEVVKWFTCKCTSSHVHTTLNIPVTPSFQIPLLHLWQPAQITVAKIVRHSKAEHSRRSET